MAYGILKADTLTYSTITGDVSIAISGITYQGASAVISGVSGIFTTSVSGATVTGNVVLGANITGVSGVFTSQLSGTVITGNTGNFDTLNAVNLIAETGVTKTNITVTGNISSSGNLTVAGTATVAGTVSGATVTGTNAQFTNITGSSIVSTTSISGVTVTGTNAQFTNVTGSSVIGTTTVSGATITGITGLFTQLNATNISGSISGYAVLSGAQSFEGGQRGTVNVVPYSTGIQLDLSSGNNFEITLTGNTTLQNPTGTASGQAGIVTIIQGSSGNTMAFGNQWNYPGGSGSTPSLTATSGAVDLLAYYVVNTTQVAYRLIQDIKA